MATPQSGIFVEGSSHHHFLEYKVAADAEPEAVRQAVGSVLNREEAMPHLVVAFGTGCWESLNSGQRIEGLRPFTALEGMEGYRIPSTQRDILFWVHGPQLDDNFDQAVEIDRRLGEIAENQLDLRGFAYHDSRDLTGFIDGTANPKADDARTVALVPEGQPGAGGSFVMSQRWEHDLRKFHARSVSEQEKIIGRTKPDSIELEGEAMPRDSHVSRTDLKQDGVPMKIVRRSVPFGTVGTHGLYFLAFSCDLTRFDILLRSMFGVSGDGIYDRLIEFSKPVTSSYWFAPSGEDLVTAFF